MTTIPMYPSAPAATAEAPEPYNLRPLSDVRLHELRTARPDLLRDIEQEQSYRSSLVC